jgi:hypothetical protein
VRWRLPPAAALRPTRAKDAARQGVAMKRRAALPWEPHYDGFEAQTAIGTYQVHENIGLVRGTYGASFQPPQGRSRLPKEWQGLGISDTIEEAKALCERHFAATARRENAIARREK